MSAKEVLQRYFAAFNKHDARAVAAFPDARYEMLVSAGGEGGKQQATHRRVSVPGASMLRVDGESIASLHGYFDRRGMLRQLQG